MGETLTFVLNPSQDIADTSVQHLAITKFAAILVLPPLAALWRGLWSAVGLGSADQQRLPPPADETPLPPRRSLRVTRLLLALAALDVVSYFIHCLGAPGNWAKYPMYCLL